MEEYLSISAAAKEIQVESHVLRYWEREFQLEVRRNELGQRTFTMQDLEKFRRIKELKERGLQLRAIKMLMINGRLDWATEGQKKGISH